MNLTTDQEQRELSAFILPHPVYTKVCIKLFVLLGELIDKINERTHTALSNSMFQSKG